jgi:nucleoside-diphosphate-sugar epimerase
MSFDWPKEIRVLVTGATGFVGRHLVGKLRDAGFHVTAAIRRESDAALFEAQNIPTWLSKPTGALDFIGPIDVVVHAAAKSQFPGVTVAQMSEDNVVLTRQLLDAAERGGTPMFIFLSSVSVYGTIGAGVVDETTPMTDPGDYGMTKRLSEMLVEERARAMSGLAIRLPAVIGDGAARHWLAKAVYHLARNESVSLFNPRAAFNNAIHIDDLATLIINAIRAPWAGFETLTVACAGELTVREVVERLRRGVGSASVLRETPSSKKSFTISFSRAAERFGFDPMDIGSALDRYAQTIRINHDHRAVPTTAAGAVAR